MRELKINKQAANEEAEQAKKHKQVNPVVVHTHVTDPNEQVKSGDQAIKTGQVAGAGKGHSEKDKKDGPGHHGKASQAKKTGAEKTVAQTEDPNTYTIVIEKGQTFNGKLIQTDEDLNRFAESVMNITRPLSWKPEYDDREVQKMVATGRKVKYRVSMENNDIRKEIEALEAGKKQFIKDPASSADYIQNLRLLDLLKQLSNDEIADYHSKVSRETTNPAEIEKSLRAYIQSRNARNKEKSKREELQAQLTAKDFRALYKEYKDYQALMGYNKPMPSGQRFTSSKIEKERIDGINNRNKTAENNLAKSLADSGFTGGIAGFKLLVEQYEFAFRKETVHVAEDALIKYKHTLFEEKKKLLDDAFLTALLEKIKNSKARESYKEADEASSAASAMSFAEKPNMEERKMAAKMRAEASSKKAEGNAAINGLSSVTPLVGDNGFDKEGFAKIETKPALHSFLENYINGQEVNIVETIKNIQANQGISIYSYESLLQKSKEKQGIAKDSIFDLIITDKQSDEANQRILSSLVIGMLAIALGLLTFGTGTVAVLMAAGNFALGAYLSVEEIDAYRTQLAAYKVDISKDEPSAVWAVIAVVGSILDAAAVARISKQLIKAGRIFNQTKDVTLTKQALKDAGLDPAAQKKVMQALEQEKKTVKTQAHNPEQHAEFIDKPENLPGSKKPVVNAAAEKALIETLEKDPKGIYGYLPNEKSRYYKYRNDFTNAEWVAKNRAIRQEYLEQSKELEKTIGKMRSQNKSSEEIGRHVVEQRNLQKVEARKFMSPEEVKVLEEGNMKIYQNPVGPNAEQLLEKYGDWEKVIESSMKKDPEINTLLGL